MPHSKSTFHFQPCLFAYFIIVISKAGFVLGEDLNLRFEGVAMTPTSVMRTGSQVSLNAYVTNNGKQDTEAIISLRWIDQVDWAYEYHHTFPAQQTQQVEVHMPIPSAWRDKDTVEVEATLFGIINNERVMLDRDGVPLRQTFRFPVNRDINAVFTALPSFPPALPWWYWPQSPPLYPYELVIGSKVAVGGTRSTLGRDGKALPGQYVNWDPIDVCVVANSDALNNAQSVDVLRGYIVTGGTVLVMLDLVPIEQVKPLLANGQACEPIDVEELSQVVFDGSDAQLNSFRLADRTMTSDEPIQLVRVITEGGYVTHFVNGWPAAIVFEQGDGRLVLMTLGSKAWQTRRLVPGDDPVRQSDFEPRNVNDVFMKKIFTARQRSLESLRTVLDQPEASLRYAQELIGNPVVPRSWIGTVLFMFLGMIGIAAVWFGASGRWDRLTLTVPVISAITGCVFVLSAFWVRREVPEMSGVLQVSQTSSDGNSSIVNQRGVVHLASSRKMELQVERPGRAASESNVELSGVKRLEHRSLDNWSLTNDDWPPGIWSYQATIQESHDARIADATFNSEGMSLELPDSLQQLQDPVVCLQPGQPMLTKNQSGGFKLDDSSIATKNRWTSATLVDDEQRRRQAVLNQLLVPDGKNRGLSNSLLGWDRLNDFCNWEPDLVTRGSQLRIIPIRMHAPQAGVAVKVPRGVIGIQNDLRNLATSTAFDPLSGRWQRRVSTASTIALRLALPACLSPFVSDEVRIDLDMNAPKRTVKIWNNSRSERSVLATLESPSLPATLNFSKSDLHFDDNGHAYVMIEVSDPSDTASGGSEDSIVHWEIQSFQVSCTGHRQSILGAKQ